MNETAFPVPPAEGRHVLTDPLESTSTPPAARSTTTRKRAPGLAISFILVHPPSKHGLSERIHFQALFHRSLALSAGPLPRPTFLSTPRARRGVSSQRRPGVARRGGRETYTERPSRPRSLPPRLGAPLPPAALLSSRMALTKRELSLPRVCCDRGSTFAWRLISAGAANRSRLRSPSRGRTRRCFSKKGGSWTLSRRSGAGRPTRRDRS